MSGIYILSNAGKLGKRDASLIFYQPDGTETVLFPFKIEQLIIAGKVSISGDAFRILSRHRIPVSFVSTNGYFNARLVYAADKNIFLRKKQYEIMDNQEGLKIAKAIVCGKIQNQTAFMQRIKRKGRYTEEVEAALVKIKQLLEDAEKAESIDSLRGFEGMASKVYFTVFRYNIDPEWADFPCRSKNPPKSNVNAVLSFLYTILAVRIETAIESQGLDTMAGTLHRAAYGRTALVFDLTEEFRTPVADTVCCALFNLGILKEDDFEEKIFSCDDADYPCGEGEETGGDKQEVRGVLLSEPGLRKTVKAFEDKMNKEIGVAGTNRKITYGKLILRQVRQYKKMLVTESYIYKPLCYR